MSDRRAELISWQTGEIDHLTEQLAEAKAALQKYEGAVEVEGYVINGPFFTPVGCLELDKYLPVEMIGQSVTVWVKRREG